MNNDYRITPYTRMRAREQNVIVRRSTIKNKYYKLDVFDSDGNYITSVGDRRFFDYPTYYDEEGLETALEKRRLYRLRHARDISRMGTRGWWAATLLW